MQTVLDAARAVARHYPGGAAALGERMGKTNLADELNPNLPRSKLGAADLVELMVLANDYRPLYAMAMETRHYPPVPMPEALAGDAPCLVKLGELAAEFAATCKVVMDGVADGRVTDTERDAARCQWQRLVACGQGLMATLDAMNAALHARAPGPQA